MSLRPTIPRRVALQQSSPPLHQPSIILKEKRKNEKEKPLNCMCANSKLSQQRGSPHSAVPNFVPTLNQKPSQTVAKWARTGIACTGAENQHDSKQSHSVLIVFGRSLNQRVAGSSPARFTKTPIKTRLSAIRSSEVCLSPLICQHCVSKTSKYRVTGQCSAHIRASHIRMQNRPHDPP